MFTKKFINGVSDVVPESLSGLCSTYPYLDYHPTKRVVLSPNWHDRGRKVAIVCGGGSGHEPFAAGFVGAGMITAAVAGSVFAAPPPKNILHALKCVSHNDNGVLVVIPNYTGDRLNFGIAIEEATQAGMQIASVVVEDDCSIPTEEQGRAGKRGLVGLIYVNKIAGALAERGKTLSEIADTAQIVADNIATYGVVFTPCSMPGHGPMFEIPNDEIEIGLGVHGEAGYKRIKWTTASEIVKILLEQIIKTLSLAKGSSVAVIVNNFGASSQLEQGIVVNEVTKQLKSKGIDPVRVYSGTLMSSLDSAGMHVSVLRLYDEFRSLFVDCLDDRTDAPCWPGRSYSLPYKQPRPEVKESGHEETPVIGRKFTDRQTLLLKQCLQNACMKIIENEENINSLDRGCGDGDCGSTHRHLAEGILAALDTLKLSHPASMLLELSWIAEERMGGTSGAIYGLMFTAAATELVKCEEEEWTRVWARAWRAGIAGIVKYSKAQSGDRTMIDAFLPAVKALEENDTSRPLAERVAKVAEAAWSGCEATKNMTPKTGRASYVKRAEFLSEVDAGSFGVATWISAVADAIVNFKRPTVQNVFF